jgi:hypothetical protein
VVCSEYEDLLVGYSALEDVQREHVDAHLEHCGECSGYLLLLSRLDEGFGDAFAGMQVPVGFRRSLSQRLCAETKPSIVPEVLDLAAGVALIGVVGLVLSRAVSETYFWLAVAVMLFALCLSIGLVSYAELREE